MNSKYNSILITGGSRGIGFSVGKHLLGRGYTVIFIDKVAPDSSEAKSHDHNYDSRLFYLNIDLSNGDIGSKIFDFCTKNDLRPFALINNVSMRSNTNLTTETETEWDQTLDISLRSAFLITKDFMLQKPTDGYRYVVNIGSIASRFASNQSPSYHAAKGGLESLTKYLAVNGPKYGGKVTVNCLELGFIVQNRNVSKFTDLKNAKYKSLAEKHLPNGEVGRDIDVANAIEFLISGKANFINGSTLALDGGATLQEQFTLLWDRIET